LPEQTYRIFAVLDMAADQPEELPDSCQMAELIDRHLDKLKVKGCVITGVLVSPDAVNEDIHPPASIHAALDLIKVYADLLRGDFDEGGHTKAAEEGLQQIEAGVAFLRGCMQGLRQAQATGDHTPQIRSLTRDNLDQAPEPILHIVAHQMGLTDCSGMDKERLVEWIKRRLDGDAAIPSPEESKPN
jgi:hypothetical protein